MKPKLFLTSSDVADMTGYSQRNARNILDWVRTEKGLVKRQAVSIFAFCQCFDFPLSIVYEYINNPDFKLYPLNEEDIYRIQSHKRSHPNTDLDFSVFEFLVHKPRKGSN